MSGSEEGSQINDFGGPDETDMRLEAEALVNDVFFTVNVCLKPFAMQVTWLVSKRRLR